MKIFRFRHLLLLGLAGAAALAAYGFWTYTEVRRAAETDEAAPADVIVVLGAAQYNGNPSPVFRARLDHALDLFQRGYANIVVTTGGYGPDPNFSEAHVGASYLIKNGIDPSQIVVDQAGATTYDTLLGAARLMHFHGWERAIVVSDGFHLHRVKQIFRDNRIEALASPAAASPIEMSASNRLWFSLREVLLISAYRLGRTWGVNLL